MIVENNLEENQDPSTMAVTEPEGAQQAAEQPAAEQQGAEQHEEGSRLWREEERIDPKTLNLKEELVYLNRVAKVVKGGRRFSFAALVVVGDGNGYVGVGFGKANEVPESISKGAEDAKKNLVRVPMRGRTIPHSVIGEFGAARVMLKPASVGTGIIAGPAVRSVLSLAGVNDVLTKCIGTNNKINVVKATIQGLASLHNADRMAKLRGKTVREMLGREPADSGEPVPEYNTAGLEGEGQE